MDVFFAIAAGLSVINAALHTVLGGREVAVPLKATNDLDPVAKWVAYYCWHLVTIVLWSMAAAFAWLSCVGFEFGLSLVLLALSGGFALGGLALPKAVGMSYKAMPQGCLFVPVFLCGLAGIVF